jgi:hypothetical protein
MTGSQHSITRRVRDYPITLDKVLPALTRRQG